MATENVTLNYSAPVGHINFVPGSSANVTNANYFPAFYNGNSYSGAWRQNVALIKDTDGNFYFTPNWLNQTFTSSNFSTQYTTSSFSDYYNNFSDYYNNIPNPSDFNCSSWSYLIPVDVTFAPGSSNPSQASVIEYRPRDAIFYCSTNPPITFYDTWTGIYRTVHVKLVSSGSVSDSITVPDQPSGSFDDTNITSAIILLSATLIVISFFSCIYKIFINRRLRG